MRGFPRAMGWFIMSPLLIPNVIGGWELWLPPPWLRKRKWMSLNDRSHWGYSSSLTKYWRDLACLKAKELHFPTPLPQAYVVATFTFGDGRRRDVHNYMPTVKAAIDGCTDAGLWADDRDGILVGPDVRRKEWGDRSLSGLLLQIYEVDGYE